MQIYPGRVGEFKHGAVQKNLPSCSWGCSKDHLQNPNLITP